MSARNLLLGTRHLHREIAMQSLQLGRDLEHARQHSANLHRIAVERATSPLVLACTLGVGFLIGKLYRARTQPIGEASSLQTTFRRTASGVAHSTLSTLQSIGWQWLIPIVIEWARTRTLKKTVQETASTAANDEPFDRTPFDK